MLYIRHVAKTAGQRKSTQVYTTSPSTTFSHRSTNVNIPSRPAYFRSGATKFTQLPLVFLWSYTKTLQSYQRQFRVFLGQ